MTLNFSRIHIILITIAMILAILLPQFMGSFYVSLLTQILIFGIFALAVNLLQGYTGLPSMGQAAFLGIAAYTVGILVRAGIKNFWLDSLAGIGVAGLLAAFFGPMVLRTRAMPFLIITTALGQCLWGLAMGWSKLTGGDDGIPSIARPNIGLPWSLTDSNNFFYFVLVFFLIVVVISYRLVRSPFGLTLVGIREGENRMRFLGYNVWLHKYLAYLLSGLFAGVAGVLLVYYKGHVGPTELHFALSAEALLMCILGGSNFLLGPVVGAAIIVLIRYLVSAYTSHWLMVLGAAYILTIYYAPTGILGLFQSIWQKRGRRWNA
jgi:branched-chain amino acid transport system permease protein